MKKIVLVLSLVLLLSGTAMARRVAVYGRPDSHYRSPRYSNRVYGRVGHPNYYYRQPRTQYVHPYNSYYYYGPEYVTTSEQVYTTGPIVTEEMIVE